MSLFCFLFWHRWRPQAVRHHNSYSNEVARDHDFATSRNTKVLLRCTRCPRVKVSILDGHWTLEQLVLGEEMNDPRIENKVK